MIIAKQCSVSIITVTEDKIEHGVDVRLILLGKRYFHANIFSIKELSDNHQFVLTMLPTAIIKKNY